MVSYFLLAEMGGHSWIRVLSDVYCDGDEMTSDALLAYFHFASLIGLAALLAAELALAAQPPSAGGLHQLRSLDGLYGLFAMLTLGSGVARVVWGAKGYAFYLGNPVFHLKVTLFVVVGLLSIYPTLKFLRWSKAARADGNALPDQRSVGKVRKVITLQLAILALIPFAATLMARGIGAG